MVKTRHSTHKASLGTNINNFVQLIAEDIDNERKVCLGFECPLFLELPVDPVHLTSARKGEGSRPWSAGAGAGSLATGLTEVLWVLNEIKEKCTAQIEPSFSVADFLKGAANLLIWEAFVTAMSKGASHYLHKKKRRNARPDLGRQVMRLNETAFAAELEQPRGHDKIVPIKCT